MSEPAVRLRAPEFATPRTPVGYSVVITNEGDEPLELNLSGREINFDLIVTGKGGERVFSRLSEGATQSILRLETLAPGESITLSDSWDQRDSTGNFVAPGFYTLQALVMTDSEPFISQDALLHITEA
jgi:hypothetical protein